MKSIRIYSLNVLVIVILFNTSACQKVLNKYKYDWSKIETRCAVAHFTKDGVFTCDFQGTYYPEIITDSTIKKWFIKVVNSDSLFYYKYDIVKTYIWDGRPKNQDYGYECKSRSMIEIIANKYTGNDTLRIKEQAWRQK